MLTNLHIAKCLAFLATLLMMLIPASSWGANYTSWNADSINTKLGACAQLRNTVIDTTDKHSGTGSAKWTSDNLQFDQVCYDVPSPAKYNGADGGWLYYRWWMKISPSFVWGNGTFKAKTGRVAPSGGTPSQVWTMYIEKQAIYVGECPMCQKEGNAVRDDPSAAYVSYEFQPSVNTCRHFVARVYHRDQKADLGGRLRWRVSLLHRRKTNRSSDSDEILQHHRGVLVMGRTMGWGYV